MGVSVRASGWVAVCVMVLAGCGVGLQGEASPDDSGGPDAAADASGSADVNAGNEAGGMDARGADGNAPDAGHDAASDAAREAASDASEEMQCTPGAVQCNGQQPQTCDSSGQWMDGTSCTNQACVAGQCSGVCAPGQMQMVPCGNCGTETDTCDATGNWSPGSCAAQGVCAPNSTQSCNTYGSQTCTSGCAWGNCSCASMAVCVPMQKQCSGDQPQLCDSCGQWQDSGQMCAAGQCNGGQCGSSCNSSNCNSGCCSNGMCLTGDSDNACGSGGTACANCMMMGGQSCQNHQCGGG